MNLFVPLNFLNFIVKKCLAWGGGQHQRPRVEYMGMQ